MVATATAAQNAPAPPPGIASTPPPAAPALTAAALTTEANAGYGGFPELHPAIKELGNMFNYGSAAFLGLVEGLIGTNNGNAEAAYLKALTTIGNFSTELCKSGVRLYSIFQEEQKAKAANRLGQQMQLARAR
jgi:hypothetical protein